MLTQHKIKLKSKPGSSTCLDVDGIFAYDQSLNKIELTLKYQGETLVVEKYDYFDCLIEIRKLLEPKGLFPYCNGASIDVYPSRMCRESTDGLVAYKMKLGRRAKHEHIVKIFDTGDDIILSTVEEQMEFFLKWNKST